MRKAVVILVGAVVVLGAVRVATQGDAAATPWQPGTCYRVFETSSRFHVFRVLAVAGKWVQVESDPGAPWYPGARPAPRVWLNDAAVFVAQEWPCSTLP